MWSYFLLISMKNTGRVWLVVVLLLMLSSFALVPIKAQNPTIQVPDPTGDDKGPGYYGYPTADVFKPGVFDIVRFEAYVDDKAVTFKVYFKDLGGNPWNGKNGFCLQQVHIYIHADAAANIPARVSAIGLNLNFDPSWAWHYAVLIGPCWETPPQPLPSGQCAVIYRPFDEIVQDDKFRVAVDGNAIVATIDRALFAYGDPANIKDWRIVVIATSHDGFGPLKIRPVGLSKGDWVIWATATANDQQKVAIANAIKFAIEPRIFDVAVYSPEHPNGITADEQYQWLSSFDPSTKTPATIPPLLPQLKAQLESITKERDSLKSQVSSLQGQVSSLQGQVSSLQSQVKSLQDENSKLKSELDSLKASTVNTGLAVGLAVVLLIVGIAAGYFVGRRGRKEAKETAGGTQVKPSQ